MCRRSMASLGLLLLAAAAAPADPCRPGVNNGSIGQAAGTGAARGSSLTELPAKEGVCDAGAAELTALQRMRPEIGLEDAMRALPPSDALRPIEQPGWAPVQR
jgi:hypothetical protein